MKKIKFILFLCLSATLLSCGDDDAPAFTLINANIAGTYNISSLESEEKATTTTPSGATVENYTIKAVADSFTDVNFILNANGTYTAKGGFRIVTTETSTGNSPVSNTEIVVFDAAGTYTLNASSRTIIFNQTSGDFIEDEFKIVTYNEKTVNISQEEIEVDGPDRTSFKGTIGLVRK
jgi:hypothetical protein